MSRFIVILFNILEILFFFLILDVFLLLFSFPILGFPRGINAESSSGLMITPEIGKAVLFYNMLPDGNMDDLSQHAALPVRSGEKWLANLWVWDAVNAV